MRFQRKRASSAFDKAVIGLATGSAVAAARFISLRPPRFTMRTGHGIGGRLGDCLCCVHCSFFHIGSYLARSAASPSIAAGLSSSCRCRPVRQQRHNARLLSAGNSSVSQAVEPGRASRRLGLGDFCHPATRASLFHVPAMISGWRGNTARNWSMTAASICLQGRGRRHGPGRRAQHNWLT